MRFPKNHMLSKYCGDIRRYGVVAGYSTSSSERQHRYDAKAPAKHVNFSSTTFIHQLSTYIFYRDLLDDQYYHLKSLAQSPSQTAAAASSSEKQLYPTFSLRSCRNNGAPISFNDLKNQKGMFRRLKTLLRTELDYQDGRMSSVAVKNLPRVEGKARLQSPCSPSFR
ncbi:hypothetical protein BX666DRAFT_1993576 [Dichotomocladium elegans]|nr:hypothetical protein BX666DRAFT_1993576 [Dichotomocladium elegans]